MTTLKHDPARIIAASLDSDPAVSVESLINKFLIRWKFFAICVVLVPLIAVGLASWIPPTYKGTAQILIRHQGGFSSLLTEFTSPISLLSGATAAEIIRGDDVASRMIETVGVQDADIARPAYKVVFGRISAFILPLLGREHEEVAGQGSSRLKYILLAKELKPSISASTLLVDRGMGAPRDEVIEVTVLSPNREKVAGMVNGLCDEFINQYNRQSAEEVRAAQKTLEGEAALSTAEITRLQNRLQSSNLQADEPAENEAAQPLASGLAKTISDMEAHLVELRQTQREDSREVIRVRDEIKEVRALLGLQESIDAAREKLSAIRKKQRELQFAAQLFGADQSGMIVVDRALTPRKSKMVQVIRYGVPAAGGLAAGIFVGVVGILLINLLDPRLFVGSDVAAISGYPLLGVLTNDGTKPVSISELGSLPHAEARSALLQASAKTDAASDTTRIILVGSAENESASASVALQLAVLMARDRSTKVLLIDANFDRPLLTETMVAQKEPGVLDILSGQTEPSRATTETPLPRLQFTGLGQFSLRDEAGSSRAGWDKLLEHSLREHGTVVLHVGGLLNSREAALLVKRADLCLLVTSRKASKRPALASAAALLAEAGASVLGVIHCQAST